MRRERTTSAFTLFELILVMAIIIITVALAAPSLAAFVRGRAVSDTAAHVVALANYARDRATVDGVVYRLSIQPAANLCSISHFQDDGSGTDTNFVPATASPYGMPYTLASGLHIQSDAPVVDDAQVIEFQPGGTCDTATIHVTDDYGNSVDVACLSPYDTFHIATGSDVAGRRK